MCIVCILAIVVVGVYVFCFIILFKEEEKRKKSLVWIVRLDFSSFLGSNVVYVKIF